jgi:diguanylate cyclase (GGDEF)-like protein
MTTNSPPAKGPRGRILVVDDHEAQRQLLAVQLEELGFEVLTAGSGRECLQIAASDSAPDVILLDVEMPVLDGIATCRLLKADPITEPIPVLFVTGWRDDDPMVVDALAAGGNDFVNKTTSTPVLAARLKSQLAIRRAHLRIQELAMTDALTGVFSRRFLFEAARRAVKAEARADTHGLGCLMVDVDHFKQLNDTVGHLEGDTVLKRIADILRAGTRETDLVARFGGEEFIVLLPHTTNEGCAFVAANLREKIEAGSPCTASIGVAWLHRDEGRALRDDADLDDVIQHLIGRADRAMYKAKQAGRNRICLWTDAAKAD